MEERNRACSSGVARDAEAIDMGQDGGPVLQLKALLYDKAVLGGQTSQEVGKGILREEFLVRGNMRDVDKVE